MFREELARAVWRAALPRTVRISLRRNAIYFDAIMVTMCRARVLERNQLALTLLPRRVVASLSIGARDVGARGEMMRTLASGANIDFRCPDQTPLCYCPAPADSAGVHDPHAPVIRCATL